MARIGSLALAFMLFASLGFAWTAGYSPSSCATQYTVAGANFTLNEISASCTGNTSWFGGITSTSDFAGGTGADRSGGISRTGTRTKILSTISTSSASAESHTATGTISIPSNSNTYSFIYETTDTSTFFGITTSGAKTGQGNITHYNSTHYNVTTNTSGSVYLAKGSNAAYQLQAKYSGGAGLGTSYVAFDDWETTTELSMTSTVGTLTHASLYIIQYNGVILRSDFKTGGDITISGAAYCQSLLYFNNPYYGNIQLSPDITYIPGSIAAPSFINQTSTAAYIPNNTISYIHDSVTGAWYIVPATICNSYSLVISTSTLQYNPTGIGSTVGGTVPFDVNSMTGSCTYNSGTLVISCTGTDSSNTITSLGLSAYKVGNTTDLCAQTAAGSIGTLTCTLPNQNGSYNAFFYGTDADLLTHQFSYKQIQIGSGNAGYGRDGYILALILFVVASMLMTSSISVSMILGCFGLFMALAFGVIPWSDAPALIFFAIVALIISYRLKI